jgi:hypothetical protein
MPPSPEQPPPPPSPPTPIAGSPSTPAAGGANLFLGHLRNVLVGYVTLRWYHYGESPDATDLSMAVAGVSACLLDGVGLWLQGSRSEAVVYLASSGAAFACFWKAMQGPKTLVGKHVDSKSPIGEHAGSNLLVEEHVDSISSVEGHTNSESLIECPVGGHAG